MSRTKYIKDKADNIIVFSELFDHSDYQDFEPKSAGFISFEIGKIGNPVCKCYGESLTLNLKSHPNDTWLANRQIIGFEAYEIEDNI